MDRWRQEFAMSSVSLAAPISGPVEETDNEPDWQS
jgi:hypothetical protein